MNKLISKSYLLMLLSFLLILPVAIFANKQSIISICAKNNASSKYYPAATLAVKVMVNELCPTDIYISQYTLLGISNRADFKIRASKHDQIRMCVTYAAGGFIFGEIISYLLSNGEMIVLKSEGKQLQVNTVKKGC